MKYLLISIVILSLGGCAHMNLSENLQKMKESIDSFNIQYDAKDDSINVNAKIKPFKTEDGLEVW